MQIQARPLQVFTKNAASCKVANGSYKILLQWIFHEVVDILDVGRIQWIGLAVVIEFLGDGLRLGSLADFVKVDSLLQFDILHALCKDYKFVQLTILCAQFVPELQVFLRLDSFFSWQSSCIVSSKELIQSSLALDCVGWSDISHSFPQNLLDTITEAFFNGNVVLNIHNRVVELYSSLIPFLGTNCIVESVAANQPGHVLEFASF